jgi:hypothetical protein
MARKAPARPPGKWAQLDVTRPCQVCKHPQAGRIDFLIVSGAGEKGRGAIAEKFGISESSISNHTRRHISAEYRAAVLAGPLRSENDLRELVAEEGISVLQNLRVVFNGHRQRWLLALEAGDDPVMIAHARAMGEMLWKIGRLTAEVLPTPVVHQNNTVINVLEHPEYIQAITKLSEALQPFPAARKAVAAALKGIAPPTIEHTPSP